MGMTFDQVQQATHAVFRVAAHSPAINVFIRHDYIPVHWSNRGRVAVSKTASGHVFCASYEQLEAVESQQ